MYDHREEWLKRLKKVRYKSKYKERNDKIFEERMSGKSCREIAEKYGLSQARVWQLQKIYKMVLREEMKDVIHSVSPDDSPFKSKWFYRRSKS
jgi:DNA-directed RNA polymerase specialized sigma subunit